MSIFNIPLDIPDVEVINFEHDRHQFIITVKSTIDQTPCRKCDKVITKRHGQDKPMSYCCDMYDGYINAAKEVFGHRVKIVIDRFHVSKHYREGLDSLRQREMRRLKEIISEQDY